jgi:hypothetical protein
VSRRETRRAQSIVPFGVGAIVEFEDEALMTAGLEAWPTREAPRLYDQRLAARLGVDHFMAPPPKPERGGVPGTMAPLPYVRFPQWHFCPRCRWLERAELFSFNPPRCGNSHASPRLRGKPPCASLPDRRRPRMLPLRFVVACRQGHIEDFPWNEWVHAEKDRALEWDTGCQPPRLYFFATKMGGLGGLLVECSTCNKRRSLMGSTSPSGVRGLGCRGKRPWLGPEGLETCRGTVELGDTSNLLALQRGASNVYFPNTTSSILIPPYSSRIAQILSEPKVRELLDSERNPDDRAFEFIAKLRGGDAKQLRSAYEAMRSGAATADPESEIAFRHAEYRALHEERRDVQDLLVCRPQELGRYGRRVQSHFAHITLVERLAETRVLTGFHRIDYGAAPPSALSLRPQNWLPAFRVQGEGIFLAVDLDRLAELANAVQSKHEDLLRRANDWGRCVLPPTVELVFLHTLAHLLIKRLAFEAGYGASSIRERVYSAPADAGVRMGGLLLYTAAGDADGTLGGLVALGRPGMLESILTRALEDAMWCASDPICSESVGQGPGSLNLAACHACSLLPETSCEFQNRLLDRDLVKRYFDPT